MSHMSHSVSYHASVITGLERLAAEELKEKLNVQAVTFQGHIRFESDADPKDVIQLRSIDNLYAVVGREKPDYMPQNESDLLSKLQLFHDSLNWTPALTAWRQVTGFEKSDMETILTRLSDLQLTGDQTEQPDDKRPKELLPKFRVTCYRAGEGHGFQSGDAAKEMGGIINSSFGWPVSMKEFDLEVVLFVKDNEWTLAVSLTKDSLHRRNLVSIGVTSLRATVCYAMLKLAELQVGDILCDPLCGSSAILVESSVAFPQVLNLAGDHHNQAITHSAANISHISKDPKNGPVDILQFDATKLPFKTGLIDAIVSDLPFGKRIGNKTINTTLYPKLLKEFARITVPSTGRAVLLTQDWKNLSKSLDSELMRKCWRMKFKMFLKLGNLATYIYILKRTSYVTN